MTDAWKYFERGRTYNNSLVPNQYTMVNTNNEFFNGNQWLNMPDNEAMRRLAKPVFNIIKRVTSLFVASITSSSTTINFEPLSHKDDAEAAAFATAEVRNLLEKFKMDYRIRDALFDGAITGDYAAHFYWNPLAQPYGGAFGAAEGEIEMELVDGINVMFGNPNSHEVEKQPYILVVGRGRVDELKAEAEQYRKRQKWRWEYDHPGQEYVEEPINISADHDMRGFTGAHGNTDLNGNDEKYGTCLYVYMYTKEWKSDYYNNPKTGKVEVKRYPSVHVTKATRDCVIYEDIDTGLARYPIAFGNWQRQKNQYHGRALVTEIIPNQIFINQMSSMPQRWQEHSQTGQSRSRSRMW